MDPIADLLVRINNASAVAKPEVTLPFSKTKESILDILKQESYVNDFKVIENKGRKQIVILIKTDKSISHIKQISKPGRRIYVKSKNLPRPLRGFGLAIVSTPQGVMSVKDARKKGVGGELLCEIW